MEGLVFEVLLKIPIAFMMCELLLRKEPNFKRVYIFAVLSIIMYTLFAFYNTYLHVAIGHTSLVIVLVLLAIVLQKAKK